MPENELNHVAVTCSNAQFHEHIQDDDRFLTTLRILDPRLKKIWFDFRDVIYGGEFVYSVHHSSSKHNSR